MSIIIYRKPISWTLGVGKDRGKDKNIIMLFLKIESHDPQTTLWSKPTRIVITEKVPITNA